MDEKDARKQGEPEVMIVERRAHGDRELSSSEVMRIVRRRAGKKVRGEGEHDAELKEEK